MRPPDRAVHGLRRDRSGTSLQQFGSARPAGVVDHMEWSVIRHIPKAIVERSEVLCSALLVFLGAVSAKAFAADETRGQRFPGSHWELAQSPESLGFSSEKLGGARRFSETLKTTAVVIVVDGVVLAQWGEPDRIYPIHSIRKSLLSALIGIEGARGNIKLSNTLAELGIDDQPPLTDAERQATVADLLTSRSGIYRPSNYETRSRAALRPPRASHRRGEFWHYNNWDFNALGTIFERASGRSVFEAFEADIARPLQMEDFDLRHTRYIETHNFRIKNPGDARPSDSTHPAYAFNMSARDLARFGLLYLRKGQWGDRRVVPENWVAESTGSHAEAEYDQSYGYMWWIADQGRSLPGFSAGSRIISARGGSGHEIAIIPHLDMVIVHRANTFLPIPSNNVSASDRGKLFQLIVDSKID